MTVIASPTCITEPPQPDRVLTISINLPILLVIHQINSDVFFYHARLRSGSSFSEVVFEALARNIDVSAFSDIHVPIFSVLPADVAVRDATVVQSLALNVWDILNAKELWELLARDLSVSVFVS